MVLKVLFKNGDEYEFDLQGDHPKEGILNLMNNNEKLFAQTVSGSVVIIDMTHVAMVQITSQDD